MPVTKPKLIRRITEEFIETPEGLDELDDVESDDDDEGSDTDEESDKSAAQRRKR